MHTAYGGSWADEVEDTYGESFNHLLTSCSQVLTLPHSLRYALSTTHLRARKTVY